MVISAIAPQVRNGFVSGRKVSLFALFENGKFKMDSEVTEESSATGPSVVLLVNHDAAGDRENF